MKSARVQVAHTFLALLAISLPLLPLTHADAASAKPGALCKKVGLKQTINNSVYTCIKSGKKLIWSKPGAPAKSRPSSIKQVNWEWMFDQHTWSAHGTPPPCNFPIIAQGALLDFSQPISLLQPGQVRGGSFKPHGGFRWSDYGKYVSNVNIYVPFDGVVTTASQYKTEGVIQFGVNIVTPCGFMIRLGHLHSPSAQFAQILSALPTPTEGDSRETSFNPPIAVKVGNLIATSVGIPPPATPDAMGTFMDFGLLDLRAPNPALPAGFSSNADEKYSKYSVCWYEGNYLSSGDRALSSKLPLSNGDSTSTYCGK